jgi:predicted P-loop ATPase/GTPase
MQERKINLEEILLKNHFHILDTLKSVYSPDTHTENMYERLMNGIKDVCEKTLELAAENAKIIDDPNSYCGNTGSEYPPDEIVSKQSILDTIKQVK